MSKISEAKKSQGYSWQSVNCGKCLHLTFELIPPAWMVAHNAHIAAIEARGETTLLQRYNLAEYVTKRNLRCGIGGFAVKRIGYCTKFAAQDAA